MFSLLQTARAENLILFSQCSAVGEGSVDWRAEMMFCSKVLAAAAQNCKTLLLRSNQVALSSRQIIKTTVESPLRHRPQNPQSYC